MQKSSSFTLNCHGKLLSLHTPRIMGVLNATPDSFFASSRATDEENVRRRAQEMAAQGATFIDVGACSSRPGAEPVGVEEEMARLRRVLPLVKKAAPDICLSVDTFRADVARMAVEEYGVCLINDVTGGDGDRQMARTVASLHVPYVVQHMQGTPQTMQQAPAYGNVVQEVILSLSRRIERLRALGVCDLIADPGFGFGKTLAQNYALMAHLSDFALLRVPLMVGVSRKSMIHSLLGITPDEALNGTTALHAIALQQGAHILRVHDVKAAQEVVKIHETLRSNQ